MLFFDKKYFRSSPRAVAERLLESVRCSGRPSLERAREWLVFAGQLEQAVLDGGGFSGIGMITNRAAALFLDVLEGAETGGARAALCAAVLEARDHLGTSDRSFRMPEGFSWYGLYPDAYAFTAGRWARHHMGQPATVIGLLSIGTSLGAIVAEQLRRCGTEVRARHAIRPAGHPFHRRAELPSTVTPGTAFIIVDEGPGLSGSSMAGTAEALQAAGVAEREIFFFPGHGHGPGGEAGPRERKWWTSERCWAPESSFTVEGASVFGGFAAVNSELETLAALKHERQSRLAEKSFALPCQLAGQGWIAIAQAGRPLRGAEELSEIRSHLAAYIAAAAMPAMEGQLAGALERIAAALGAFDGKKPSGWKSLRDGLPPLLHGDGRLGPDQWVRGDDGRILKRNAMGTDWEHDWTGPQSVLWDVAGAAVEWNMMGEGLASFLADLSRFGITVTEHGLAFHIAGYCCLEIARAHVTGSPRAAGYEARLNCALEHCS